ncbi:hypothetical protein FQA39_LY13014 [Lamprigera yunnana]|nr:hypothetical protein FQA39_LY13014 [Lamprigera yunnana]
MTSFKSIHAVTKAMTELRDIDMALVNAQLSRQMLDKIIGYLVSKSLQKNTGLLSAGRVQTPALTLAKDNEGVTVNTDKTYYISEEKSQEIAKALSEELKCTNYASKGFETRSFIPYSTAGLLQDGFSKLRLSTAQVSIAAQKLYEEGFVTYIRTDSTKYSNDFTKDAKAYINKNFEGNLFKDVVEVKKAMNAQEAHESIRPVDLHNTPDVVSNQITDATQKRLYNLI